MFSNSAFTIKCATGEGVADLLGLDDSKFQDVIDTMTEEEWEEAREVGLYFPSTLTVILFFEIIGGPRKTTSRCDSRGARSP